MSESMCIESSAASSLESAYRAVLPELEAMTPDEVVPVNLEIMGAVMTAHGVLPELAALRPRIAKLPEFDLRKFDRLGIYASAAAYAQSLHMVAVQPPDGLGDLVEEGMKLRELLFAEAGLLVVRGVLREEALRDVRRGPGFKILATDLQLLVNVFETNSEKIDGKLVTTREEIERAGNLVFKLIEILGLREQGPAEVARTMLMRDRAYSRFVETYDHARRAVSYLRWREGDTDSIIPSLYRGRGGRKKKARAARTAEFTPSPEVQTASSEAALPRVGT